MWHHINPLSLSVCLLLSCLLSLPLPQTYMGLCAQRHTHIASAIQIHISIYHTYKLISQVSTEPKVTCCRGAWIHQGCEKVISCPPSFFSSKGWAMMWTSRGGAEVREGSGWGGINRFICLCPSLIILPLPFVPDLMKPKCQVRRGPHIESCQSRPSAHLKLWRRIIGFNTRAAYAARHDASDDSTAKALSFFFSKEELHLAADAQEIAQERILSVDG